MSDVFDDDDELVEVFLEESEENLEALSRQFILLESEPENLDVIQTIFRAVHSLKGNAAFFGLNAIKHLAHDVEEVLDDARNGRIFITPSAIDAILAATDELREMLTRVRNKAPLVPDEAANEKLFAALRECREDASLFPKLSLHQSVHALLSVINAHDGIPEPIVEAAKEVEATLELLGDATDVEPEAAAVDNSVAADCEAPAAPEAAVDEQTEAESPATPDSGVAAAANSDEEPRAKRAKPQKLMRVPEEKVDAFMSFVGELIITSEAFAHLQRQLREANTRKDLLGRFASTLSGFESLSNNLQRSILDIRLVAAESLTRRVPRMVRDLARDLGKDVRCVIEGESTLVDKSILEGLDAPLTHLIRNCVDHGMETPKERADVDKEAVGTVHVHVERDGNNVVFTVSDDGKGISLDKLRNKAVEVGKVSAMQAEKLTSEQVLNFIFESGMSTAKEISEVSGRGVGMDVVRSSVEDLGGTIDVTSTAGEGTTFTLVLPTSTTKVVLQTIVVRVGEESYCIPIDDVQGIVHHPEAAAHHRTFGEVITIRDVEHRVVRLSQVLDLGADDKPLNDGVHIQVGDETTGMATLFVDEIVGRQQAVVRPLPAIDTSDQLFSGVAIFGSGDLGMVLSAESILHLPHRPADAA